MNKRQKQRRTMIIFFTRALTFSSFFARRPALTPVTTFLMWGFAKLTLLVKGGKRKETIEEIGKEWQRMFPTRLYANIRQVTGDTACGKISGTCPVAGTGDVQACYRLMEYDRQLLKHIGGEFVVLESKADSSVSVCRVAMRV